MDSLHCEYNSGSCRRFEQLLSLSILLLAFCNAMFLSSHDLSSYQWISPLNHLMILTNNRQISNRMETSVLKRIKNRMTLVLFTCCQIRTICSHHSGSLAPIIIAVVRKYESRVIPPTTFKTRKSSFWMNTLSRPNNAKETLKHPNRVTSMFRGERYHHWKAECEMDQPNFWASLLASLAHPPGFITPHHSPKPHA